MMMNNNLSQEATVMRAALQQDQKITKTCLTKGGDPNKQVCGDGCIVPTGTLNNSKHIVLTPAGLELYNAWRAGDQVLRTALDDDLMTLLGKKLVASSAARKKADKESEKEETKRLGFKKLSKSKACTNCGTNTLKAYTFNILGGKKIPYCHRKDCVEARDQYAAAHGSPAPSPMASVATVPSSPMAAPVVSNDNNSPAPSVVQSPARAITDYTEDELMAKIMETPDGPFKLALLRKFDQLFGSGSVSSEATPKRRAVE